LFGLIGKSLGKSLYQTIDQLVEKFLGMVREQTGQQLDTWLKEVEDSHLEAFASFATGVRQDK
jgi:transposase